MDIEGRDGQVWQNIALVPQTRVQHSCLLQPLCGRGDQDTSLGYFSQHGKYTNNSLRESESLSERTW